MPEIKKSLEFSIPADQVAQATARAVAKIQRKVRLPGFRPGKVPVGIIRTRFSSDIREEVIRNLVPKRFQKAVVAADVMVMPRSRSCSIQSMVAVPSWTSPILCVLPV